MADKRRTRKNSFTVMLPNALSCRVALRLGASTSKGRLITTRQVEIRPPKSEDGAMKKKQDDPEEIDKFLRMIDNGKLGFDPWGQPLPMFGEGHSSIMLWLA